MLIGRSLFVKFKYLWEVFDVERRARWTAYWGTLPFSSHSGLGQWPGSGYSAFVYVNAPRYKNEQDLLIDPPGYLNLCVNGDLHLGVEGWFLGNGIYYQNNRIVFNGGISNPIIKITPPEYCATISLNTNYNYSFDYTLTTGLIYVFLLNIISGQYLYLATISPSSGNFSQIINISSARRLDGWSANLDFSNNAVGTVFNFSLK
jgi:hypothetical protein